jgi:predicted glycoside hydrolase/deacetylase ChbG (UPF0249 family)
MSISALVFNGFHNHSQKDTVKLLFLYKIVQYMTFFFLADDAGIGNTATAAILDAWQEKLLDGFSIVANKECYLQIQERLLENSSLACVLAAHLNLTDGKAMIEDKRHQVIADAKGRLRISFAKALWITIRGGKKKQHFLTEVAAEWDAQLRFIKEVCGDRKLVSVNGHNHIHMIPSLFPIIAALSHQHNIPFVRIPKEYFFCSGATNFLRPFFYRNMVKWIVLWICFFFIRKRTVSFKPFTTEVFGVLFSGHASKKAVASCLASAKKRNVISLEMIFHPGQSVEHEMAKWATFSSGKAFFLHPNRAEEMKTLKQLKYD